MFVEFLRRTWAQIDINALKNNYENICRICKCIVIPVVKADAYGHGAVEVSKALKECGAKMFAVSNVSEAIVLRSCGISDDILVLGYTPEESVSKLIDNNITQCIYSYKYALMMSEKAIELNGKIKSHLKLDTGMGRIGFSCRNGKGDLEEIKETLKLGGLDFTGVFTHFASADGSEVSDMEFTKEQYKNFTQTIDLLEKSGYSFKMKHCCNSAGILEYNDMYLDAVRAGIILYGLAPSDDVKLSDEFKPVMSFYSVVSMVKTVETDDTVSYGRTYTADKKRKIATVSAGYADGVPRLLSNKGFVFLNGKKVPIVGRVCMDQFCIDITDIEDVSIGDTVEIFGDNISVDEVADYAETINYEIVCGIGARVPKVFIKD